MGVQRFLRSHPIAQSTRSRHHTELMRLLRDAADQGDPWAMYTYGNRLWSMGREEEGREWLAKAAETNFRKAKHALAAADYFEEPNSSLFAPFSLAVNLMRLAGRSVLDAIPSHSLRRRRTDRSTSDLGARTRRSRRK